MPKASDLCANCNDYRREHFEHTGVCRLGFCDKTCSRFIEKPTEKS